MPPPLAARRAAAGASAGLDVPSRPTTEPRSAARRLRAMPRRRRRCPRAPDSFITFRRCGTADDSTKTAAMRSCRTCCSPSTAIGCRSERQRRVAIAATIAGGKLTARPDPATGQHPPRQHGRAAPRLIGGEFGRAPGPGPVGATPGTPTALRATSIPGSPSEAGTPKRRAFPTRVTDRRPTFRGLLRLDHVFFRLAAGWRGEFRRGDDRFGSDHYPLIGRVRFR